MSQDSDDFGYAFEDLEESRDPFFRLEHKKKREREAAQLPRNVRDTLIGLGSPREDSHLSQAFKTFQKLLPFAFRPLGFQLFGVDKTSVVHSFRIGSQEQLSVTSDVLPGLYFQSPISFKELYELLLKDHAFFQSLLSKDMLERHAEFVALYRPNEATRAEAQDRDVRSLLADHQKFKIDTCGPHQNLMLVVSGPIEHAVFWGKSLWVNP